MATYRIQGPLLAFDTEEVGTLTSSTALTSTLYCTQPTTNGSYAPNRYAEQAIITIETADIRWTCDGTTPTVTSGTGVGHLSAPGDVIELVGTQNIQRFRAINAVASSGAKLRVTYLR